HMPALFTQALAERLDRISDRKIVEASDAEPVVAGRVYIAPGGRHLTLRRVSASPVEGALDDGAPENSCRASVDVLFRSAAQAYGAGSVAVVLTGMGSDGRRGCEAIHRAGGTVLCQDAASSVVASMPLAVAEAGLAHAVLPLDDLGPTLAGWL